MEFNNLAYWCKWLEKNFSPAKGYKTKYNIKEIGSGLNDSRPKLNQLLSDNDIDITKM